MRRLVLVAGLLAACTSHAEVEAALDVEAEVDAPGLRAEKKVRVQKPAVRRDARSSYALAADISKALSEPSLTRAQSLERVRTDWQGKRYRWDVGVSAPLCRLGACSVFPFDHASVEDRIVAGWLPRLDLSPEVHADLIGRCGSRLCVATIEGTLKTFVFSPEEPTSLRLSDVSVLGVRARREDESWARRKADPRVAKLRTRNAGR
ncbi:MAG: hypothetical protein KUG77_22120 [Nannocystaceae bacterium]|nr:hypothetical protein [Nannocystaceae bacterium]